MRLSEYASTQRTYGSRKVPRSVQQSIPIDQIYEDGTWRCGNVYSQMWSMPDINFTMSDEDNKAKILNLLGKVYMGVPSDCWLKICIVSQRMDEKSFRENVLLHRNLDGLDKWRVERNRRIRQCVQDAGNVVQHKYLILSTNKQNVTDARSRLRQVQGNLLAELSNLGCTIKPTPCVYYKVAAEYGDGYAQTLGNMVLDEFLEEEATESKVKPGILPEAAFEFLWYDPTVKERDLKELPLSRYFEDLGLLQIRESWERDSKVLTIKCGHPGGKKQWKTGWQLYRQEGIRCLALSHHHPDNLSYIFARGGEYLTCEDGYNRNIMPDNHNVILVDGMYTDAKGVNDVYMSSVALRQQEQTDQEIENSYVGDVTCFQVDGSVVIYKGETSGIYPRALSMKEVSRTLFTDGLNFWVFVDVCRSDEAHIYQLISNTVPKAVKAKETGYLYPMQSGNIRYTVFSDKKVQEVLYDQDVVAVMTTQEPDKVCHSHIETLCTKSAEKVCNQVFFECFTFDEENAQVEWNERTLRIICKGKKYEIRVDENQTEILIKKYTDAEEKSWIVR